jgi:hypothetical protein
MKVIIPMIFFALISYGDGDFRTSDFLTLCEDKEAFVECGCGCKGKKKDKGAPA